MAMFYHGFDNYMEIAFPEDELRPVSCTPLARDRENPGNIGLNDALGNYSLTLIDNLSTLAIFASSPPDSTGKTAALERFQDTVELLVDTYGDGTKGPKGQGTRERGFDLDSKVQVFETVIRGVGGLLSAHLFAIGELPIRGYAPKREKSGTKGSSERSKSSNPSITWPSGFVYDGQLLRLAHDLGERLLPAFHTTTGLPYPRVNLRHGIPFYPNSPLHHKAEGGPNRSQEESSSELTENCSAGAGTLVLELVTLSRLTGDDRFEILGKRAFWEVWNRRSEIGLVGTGIDSENGRWTSATTGIGAGVDSFLEYALKSHILLSGQSQTTASVSGINKSYGDDDNRSKASIYTPLHLEQDSPSSFLSAWHEAYAAVKRHLYREFQHPHYINAHINTGSPQALWIDSLGAYYPGLLVLAGELDEAIETSLLYTALWTRYSALPERWSTRDGDVEGGLGWWPGRPEFIESNYHLYRATQDPWYLHVGEMVLRDIKRRCWTECGWASLQDVRTGELADRMESFFLGETAKYLYLLFDSAHPLNHLDGSFVFTTEAHPLVIPRGAPSDRRRPWSYLREPPNHEQCPKPPALLPFSMSATAARQDLFHAASLTGLHLLPNHHTADSPLVGFTKHHPSITISDLRSPTNHTFYPWTLPVNLIPSNGSCSRMAPRNNFEIQFPTNNPNIMGGQQTMGRVSGGLLINDLDGVRLGLVEDDAEPRGDGEDLVMSGTLRIHSIGGFLLGRDEKVFIKRTTVGQMVDPNFTRVRDGTIVDLVVDPESDVPTSNETKDANDQPMRTFQGPQELLDFYSQGLTIPDNSKSEIQQLLGSIFTQLPSALVGTTATSTPGLKERRLIQIPAILPRGLGAAPLPDLEDESAANSESQDKNQPEWNKIFLSDESCDDRLSGAAPRDHQIIVMKRGGCSFSRKLANIPSFTPDPNSLQLVIVVSYEDDAEHFSIRPILDQDQSTPGGLTRHNRIAMVLVGGGDTTYRRFANARGIGLRRRYQVRSQGLRINNLIVL
ncbi:MAG: alpha mannosidase-like protein [Sclerophora amabilis]|nr:MAG: alpha mannosidase-like protein [Sclerophora amabilis]